MKKRTIHHLFAKFGKVDAVWLRCAALADPAMPKKVAVIKQEFHPDRKSISAFVRFESADSAVEACCMSGTEFGEQHIAVSRLSDSRPGKPRDSMNRSIFVGNLPFGIEDEALWQHFSLCGTISDVRIVRDRTNGMGKGFGYVNFNSADAVELALKLDQSTVENREIRVSRCKRNPKPFVSPDAAAAAAKDDKTDKGKAQGAYKRVQDKKARQERQKEGGWISKMRKNKKTKTAGSTSSQVQSFAGETVGTSGQKVLNSLRFFLCR